MRAVTVSESKRLAISEFDEPKPLPSEALVRLKAVSLNRGEVRRCRTQAPAGYRPGWDLAGAVERAAADGTGPKAGSRVVGLLTSRAWAEVAAVPSNALAVLPDNVTFAQAACLPVAGLTALHALDRRNSLLGRRILVTGATGGVGHFACRLGNIGGAHVVGAVRKDAQAQTVLSYGAHETVTIGDDPAQAAAKGPYDLVIESIGGESLGASLSMLKPDGLCVFVGQSAGTEAKFDTSKLFWTGGAQLYGLILFRDLQTRESAAIGLARLAGFVADGRLNPDIALEKSWTEIDAVADMLMQRDYAGKAVLHL
jgi:NADPH:quinone reductase-like Zn-dependent oxidoreductase